MMMARRLNHTANLPQQDSAERALNKLGRTYAVQMATLKRCRSKGQQTVRVERVTVESGGQAIVGSVSKGGAKMKSDVNPMHPMQRLQNAPRCTARSKRTDLPCCSPAVRGWRVCRMPARAVGRRKEPPILNINSGGNAPPKVLMPP
jgi:hypothetical protein